MTDLDRRWKHKLLDLYRHDMVPAEDRPRGAQLAAEVALEEMRVAKLDGSVQSALALSLLDVCSYMAAVAAEPKKADLFLAAMGQSISNEIAAAVWRVYIHPALDEIRVRERDRGTQPEYELERAQWQRERAQEASRN